VTLWSMTHLASAVDISDVDRIFGWAGIECDLYGE